MYVGCHVSIRHGFYHAAKTAHSLDASVFQYFPKNPRSLSVKGLDKNDARLCKEFCREHGILSIAHVPYPTNLAEGDKERQETTVLSLLNDLWIAEHCGSLGVVVHFGKVKGNAPLEGYRQILTVLQTVLSRWEGNALLLIENQAGTGGIMGTTFEEMVHIRRLSGHAQKIGFCFDTCHAFASGLWSEKNWEKFVESASQSGYFSHLRVVHLNDSVYPAGSRKDRHANIGKGKMNPEFLRRFLLLPDVRNIPVVLETPPGEDGTHRSEIRLVKQWREE